MAGIFSVEPVRGTHERRLLVTFNAALGSGAWSIPGRFTVTSQDGRGVSPAVVWLFQNAGKPATAELVLGDDLVKGGHYVVAATAVPLYAGGTVAGSAPLFFGGRA